MNALQILALAGLILSGVRLIHIYRKEGSLFFRRDDE